MTLQGEQFLPAGRVPYLCGLVVTRRGQTLAVRAPGHATHVGRVSVQGEQLLPAVCIPHHRGPIASRGQALAVRAPGHAVHEPGVAASA